MKALAFADDIKKKFNISYVNFDFWYKVNKPGVTIYSSAPSSYDTWSWITCDYTYGAYEYVGYKYIPVYGTNISFGSEQSSQPSGPYVTYPTYKWNSSISGSTTKTVYAKVDDITSSDVYFSTVSASGYTKKTMALSKNGTKKVEFGPDTSGSSSDTITLTNVDFS